MQSGHTPQWALHHGKAISQCKAGHLPSRAARRRRVAQAPSPGPVLAVHTPHAGCSRGPVGGALCLKGVRCSHAEGAHSAPGQGVQGQLAEGEGPRARPQHRAHAGRRQPGRTVGLWGSWSPRRLWPLPASAPHTVPSCGQHRPCSPTLKVTGTPEWDSRGHFCGRGALGRGCRPAHRLLLSSHAGSLCPGPGEAVCPELSGPCWLPAVHASSEGLTRAPLGHARMPGPHASGRAGTALATSDLVPTTA